MATRTTTGIFLACVAVALLSGCMSTKAQAAKGITVESDVPGGSVSLSLLTKKDIRASYGFDLNTNPYLLTGGAVFKNPDAYLVLRLAFTTTNAVSVEINQVAAITEKGNVHARLFTKADYIAEEESLTPQIQNQSTRHSTVEWTYLPGDRFSVDKGKHGYVLVLWGTSPYPEGLTVQARFVVDGQPQTLEFPLPYEFSY